MEYLEINHNLLSAYIDNDVSEEERFLIELAIENEPQVAWEIATLQQTVSMLNNLSESDLPLFTKPLKKTPLEPSSAKLYQVKSSPVKIVSHNKMRRRGLGKLDIVPSKKRVGLGFANKLHDTNRVTKSLHQNFKLAQQIFWQLGSPFWRGVAIVGFILLLLLLGSDLLLSLIPYFKTFLVKAQYTTQINISTMQSTSSNIGLGIHRTYLLIIYLVISTLTFMSMMLWWRSNSYH